MKKLTPTSRNSFVPTVIAGGAVVLIAVVWIFAVHSVQSLRQNELANAYTNTANLARTFEEHAVRTLDAVDQVLLRIKLEHERRGKPLRSEELAAEHRARNDMIGAIAVTDADGNIVAHSLPFKPTNVADRVHFKAAAARDTEMPEIGTPSRGLVTGLWSFPVVRRVNKSDGSFAGLVHASLEIAYFEKFYKELNVGRDGVIALDGRDGVRRAGIRRERTDAGERIKDLSLASKRVERGESQGSHLTVQTPDDIPRVVSFRALERYPLIVVVGISEREALVNTGEFARNYYTGATAFSAFILLMAFLLIRTARQQEQAGRLLLGQKDVLQGIATGWPLADSLDAICRLAETEADGMLCSILLLDADGVRVRHGAAPSLPAGFVRLIDGSAIGPAAGSCGTAVFRRKQVIVEDIATDPLWAGYRAWALPLGLRACWSTPVYGTDEKLLGTFAMYYREPRAPGPEHVRPIEMAAQTAAIAIQRHRAIETLRESEDRNRGIVESALDCIVNIDQQGRIIEFNPAAVRTFGYSRAEAIGKSVAELIIPPTLRERHHRGFARHLATGEKTFLGKHIELTAMRADGREFPVEVTIAAIPRGGELRFAGFLRDITERKRGEQKLRRLSQRLMETEEAERRNISRELHDRVGQNLSALNLNLGMIRAQLPEGLPATLGTRLDDAQQLLETTSQQVRNVMAELRPAALDDYGLLAALRNLAASVAARLGIAVTAEGKEPDPRLPLTTETALFRIVQEALSNVAKHAQARRVKVMLAVTPQRVSLTVVDDGVGFDTGRPSRDSPTYGIVMMRERAEAAGARLKIESAPGKGTRVEIELEQAFS
jgi:PAS domain S-box-containing protein